MGYGDEIMAIGCAQAKAREVGCKVAICDKHGRPRPHKLFQLCEAIDPKSSVKVINGPGARPYLYSLDGRKAIYTGFKARDQRARFVVEPLTLPESDLVLLEPVLAPNSNTNKRWPPEYWVRLNNLLLEAGYKTAQFDHLASNIKLNVTTRIPTRSYIEALRYLPSFKCSILHEGGLHHGAAAVGAKAAVVFGAQIPVQTTGYPDHLNIVPDVKLKGCGMWAPCEHCLKAMVSITPNHVFEQFVKYSGGL